MGQTYQSIVIDAPTDKVWKAIRDFHDMGWAPNVITDLKIVGDKKGDQVGAGRVLNDAFHETLLHLDDEKRIFSYQITDGPSPLSRNDVDDYIGRVSVKPVTEGRGTFVEWSSTWDGKEKSTKPFCHEIYVALLTDMKESLS